MKKAKDLTDDEIFNLVQDEWEMIIHEPKFKKILAETYRKGYTAKELANEMISFIIHSLLGII